MPPSQRPMVVGGYVHPQPGVCLCGHMAPFLRVGVCTQSSQF